MDYLPESHIESLVRNDSAIELLDGLNYLSNDNIEELMVKSIRYGSFEVLSLLFSMNYLPPVISNEIDKPYFIQILEANYSSIVKANIFKLMLEYGYNPNKTYGSNNNSVLMYAIIYEEVEIAKVLIDHPSLDLFHVNRSGQKAVDMIYSVNDIIKRKQIMELFGINIVEFNWDWSKGIIERIISLSDSESKLVWLRVCRSTRNMVKNIVGTTEVSPKDNFDDVYLKRHLTHNLDLSKVKNLNVIKGLLRGTKLTPGKLKIYMTVSILLKNNINDDMYYYIENRLPHWETVFYKAWSHDQFRQKYCITDCSPMLEDRVIELYVNSLPICESSKQKLLALSKHHLIAVFALWTQYNIYERDSCNKDIYSYNDDIIICDFEYLIDSKSGRYSTRSHIYSEAMNKPELFPNLSKFANELPVWNEINPKLNYPLNENIITRLIALDMVNHIKTPILLTPDIIKILYKYKPQRILQFLSGGSNNIFTYYDYDVPDIDELTPEQLQFSIEYKLLTEYTRDLINIIY